MSELKGKQSWLTRQGAGLEQFFPRIEELLVTSTEQPSAERQLQLRMLEIELKKKEQALEKALDNFTRAADAATLSEENKAKADSNVFAAHTILDRAQQMSIEITKKLEELQVDKFKDASESTRPMLAPLTIPTFTGQLWKWDQFWGIFTTAVHKRNFSKIEKLNYLLQSLEGSAKETLADLQMTEDNYDIAIQLLQRKFGNQEAIVGQLLQGLQELKPRSSRTVDQHRTLDKLLTLVSQLRQKGEIVDTQQMRRIILGKFTEKIQRAMLKRKKALASSEEWTTQRLLQDLQDYFEAEIEIQHFKGISEDPPRKDFSPRTPTKPYKDTAYTTTRSYPCFYCRKSDHTPVFCKEFQSYDQRIERIRKLNLCRNCGASSHSAKDCTRGACRQCNEKGHHTSICIRAPATQSETRPKQTLAKAATGGRPTKKATSSQSFATIVTKDSSATSKIDAILRKSPTAPTKGPVDLLIGKARIWNIRTQEFEDVHVMLDTGADQSFIMTDYARHLGMEGNGEITLQIHTFGKESATEKTCKLHTVEIEDSQGTKHQFKVAEIEFIVGKIQRSRLHMEDKQYLAEHGIQLSVSAQEQRLEPKLLLGCADLFTLFDGDDLGKQRSLPSGLKLLHSRIGYLVTGRNSKAPDRRCKQLYTLKTHSNEDEDELTRWDKYWSLESSGIEEFTGPQTQEMSDLNKKVWDQFRETVTRTEQGYFVRLPWKDKAEDLPDNRTIAYNRLKSVLNKLKDEPELLLQYHNTFRDQLKKGIIEEVDQNDTPTEGIVHYLAHQAVLTPHKDTTKLRVVFDGSAHYKNAPCLNDKLHQGPVILPSLIGMLMRFRLGRIAIVSDIEKAFLQVHLHKIDRDATRCLWIRDVEKPLNALNMVVYRFTRVTFGLNCSPFLLGATILHHLHNTSNTEIAEQIKDNIYVDNLMMTASTPKEALERCTEARQLFAEINMNLREFRTNSTEVNERLPQEILSASSKPKVLGILWDSENDTMDISCSYPEKTVTTKRTVSEQVASVYDPLGWLAPLTLKPKLFWQELWRHEYTWDQKLSEDHKRQWEKIRSEIQGFKKGLHRNVGGCSSSTSAQLVAFSDASKSAMAACVYLVKDGCSHLLISKSKLPSIKDTPTIPKLETNAVTMATRLIRTVFKEISNKTRISSITVYTDSEIALNWITTTNLDKKVGVLVRNRTREIHKICNDLHADGVRVTFGFVNTTLNPADCATRGLTKNELLDHFWWKGPPFLSSVNYEDDWPPSKGIDENPLTQDSMSNQTVFQNATISSSSDAEAEPIEELLDWNRYSSLTRATTTVAYALRWIRAIVTRVNPELQLRLQNNIPILKEHFKEEFVTASERQAALRLLLKNHQNLHVKDKIKPDRDRLNPVMDSYSILRCRGRLHNADLSEDGKSPILIGPRTPLAKAIIAEAHGTHHIGLAHTMSKVREKYWIPQLRNQVRKLIRRCVPCQRLNNLPYRYPELSDLPSRRVKRSRPFQHVGIDYFGPITIKSDEEVGKAYGVILTCTTTRLIHLDCVSDSSTSQLLNALRRFFARRGVPETITSDNAPYFLLANEILRDAVPPSPNQPTLEHSMSTRGISWLTITPYAPWQGAFYERLIKSVKYSLYKTIGRSILTMGDLLTILIEIEGTLNTRPLTYQEEHWDTRPSIRPIDFLQKDIIITYPMDGLEMEQADADYYPAEEALQLRTKRQAEEALRSSVKFTDKFWKIWNEQYITALREHHTRFLAGGHGSPLKPQAGTVVLISDPNLPRNTWKLGRITKATPNQDGVIRDVELLLPSRRVVRRPVNLLIPLELMDDSPTSTEAPATLEMKTNVSPATKPEEVEANQEGEEENLGRGRETRMDHHHYDLRRRPRVDYGQLHHGMALICLMLCSLATSNAYSHGVPVAIGLARARGILQCTDKGPLLKSMNIEKYELCNEQYCVLQNHPPSTELIEMPPEITFREYSIQWKISAEGRIKTLETRCPAAEFCSQVNCWFCTANVFNPECHPRGAIFTIMVITLITIATTCILCYAFVKIGRLLMIIISVRKNLSRTMRAKLAAFPRRQRQRPGAMENEEMIELRVRSRFVPLILVFMLIQLVTPCQDVDIFEHKTLTCSNSVHNRICRVETTEIIKLNTYNREACFRLQYKGKLIKEIRIKWNRLQLLCDKQTVMFTRQTKQHVVAAKRCSHAGSCVGEKCAAINTTVLLPELYKANLYPGLTLCVESCGGPGCGCFYLSSGCLFYRIFAKPVDKDIYEIFKCPRWREEVVVELSTMQPNQPLHRDIVILRPTIAVQLRTLTLALSSLTVPPTPALQTEFITDGNHIALWTNNELPTLRCPSGGDAQNLSCNMRTNCRCQPAESTVNCLCADANITADFRTELQHRLPVQRPWIRYEELQRGQQDVTVLAVIPSLSTAELLFKVNEEFDSSIKEVTDSICKIKDSTLEGCYHCAKGALASITCHSQELPTMATVTCDQETFTVPCDAEGKESTLHFSFTRAQVKVHCTTSCGQTKTHFELTGVLHWTNTIYSTAQRLLERDTNVYNEITLPDVGHIFSVMKSWYKFSLAVTGLLLICIATEYLLFWSCGLQVIVILWRIIWRFTANAVRLAFRLALRAILVRDPQDQRRVSRETGKEPERGRKPQDIRGIDQGAG